MLDKNYYYFTVKEDMPISFSLNQSGSLRHIMKIKLSPCVCQHRCLILPQWLFIAAALPDNEMILMITAEEVPSAAERTKLHAFAVLIRDRLLQQLNSSFPYSFSTRR